MASVYSGMNFKDCWTAARLGVFVVAPENSPAAAARGMPANR
jgi:hypothetical protein